MKKKKDVKFPKERLLSFRQFAQRKDVLHVLLKDGEEYSIRETNKKLQDFMKGKVK